MGSGDGKRIASSEALLLYHEPGLRCLHQVQPSSALPTLTMIRVRIQVVVLSG